MIQFHIHQPQGFKEWFDEMVKKYNNIAFIYNDPISIPHQYHKKEDIEIAGFFASIMAWGHRLTILRKCNELMARMDKAPAEYILYPDDTKYKSLQGFVHRTLNSDDIIFLVRGLQKIYGEFGGLESVIAPRPNETSTMQGIMRFRKIMMQVSFLPRHSRLIPNPANGSAAKRLNMFLRWMIRKDVQGVDFGLWKASPARLMCPLDVHSGRAARSLGLLHRKYDDWKAVEELTTHLRILDINDPVKYDFALFGLSVDKTFKL